MTEIDMIAQNVNRHDEAVRAAMSMLDALSDFGRYAEWDN